MPNLHRCLELCLGQFISNLNHDLQMQKFLFVFNLQELIQLFYGFAFIDAPEGYEIELIEIAK